ncbi:MAG: pyrroline-5-carboxylate reductase family protein, partial [Myxococcales bacterium]
MQTLGFIGVGNMGEALVRGLVQAGTARPQDVLVSARRKERVEELTRLYGVRGGSNSEVARQSDVVVLAVKPQILDQVLREIAGDIDRNKLIISVAAGVPIAAIERRLHPPLRIVRTMPNTPATVRAG